MKRQHALVVRHVQQFFIALVTFWGFWINIESSIKDCARVDCLNSTCGEGEWTRILYFCCSCYTGYGWTAFATDYAVLLTPSLLIFIIMIRHFKNFVKWQNLVVLSLIVLQPYLGVLLKDVFETVHVKCALMKMLGQSSCF